MIDERADLHQIGELPHPADVVAVVVRDQQIVDLFDAGGLGGALDAVGIAALETSPACVDEQGLARWADNQRGLAAFDINEENLERPGDQRRQQGGQKECRGQATE